MRHECMDPRGCGPLQWPGPGFRRIPSDQVLGIQGHYFILNMSKLKVDLVL